LILQKIGLTKTIFPCIFYIIREKNMKNLIPTFVVSTFMASSAFSGGWETGRLDNSFLYEDGGYAQFGVLSVNYGVEATIQHPSAEKHKMAKKSV
jgi:hypothetical protein